VYLARAIYRFAPNRYAVLLPLTSPYGPGALWGKYKAGVIFPGKNLKAGLELLFLANNSRVNLVDTPYETNNSLNGFDQWFFSIDFPFSYTWRNFEFMINQAILLGSKGSALEFTVGVRFSLEGKRFF
jgi:hypothetical protein